MTCKLLLKDTSYYKRSWNDAPEKQAITCLNYEQNVFFYAIFNDSMWICPANERQCYNVTQSLIGWVHSQNDPCILGQTRPADLLLTSFSFKDYT